MEKLLSNKKEQTIDKYNMLYLSYYAQSKKPNTKQLHTV